MTNTTEHWSEGAPLWEYAANGENGFCGHHFSDVEQLLESLREWLADTDDKAEKAVYRAAIKQWEAHEPVKADEFIYGDDIRDLVVLPCVAPCDGSLY